MGVARQLQVTAELKRKHADLIFVGSGYSYLQDWLPHVAQALVRSKGVDSVGLGRMVLSYPELPADVLAGRVLSRKKVCRTFSDCTTAPRNGLISGCYPLDRFYKTSPQHDLHRRGNRNINGPKLGADAASTQAWNIGMKIRLRLAQIDLMD